MSEKSERGTKGKNKGRDSSMAGGEVYQSKKAKGDVKRKNKHDPYSYLPLRKDMLRQKQMRKVLVKWLNLKKRQSWLRQR